MEPSVLTVGSLIYVTSHGPCWGFRGTIRAVETIIFADAQEHPQHFYLVILQEGQVKEPLWLVHDDVAAVEGDNVAERRSSQQQPSRAELEALEIITNAFEREPNETY